MHLENNSKIQFFHRLHFKIATFVIVTIIVIFGFYSIYQFLVYQKKLAELQKESSLVLGRSLVSSLEIAMLNSDIKEIQHSIENVATHKDIVRIFLLNNKNEVKASSERENVGSIRSKIEEGCYNCHDSPGEIPMLTSLRLAEEDILRVVVPILNKPSCYGCHDKSIKYNGLLILDNSLVPIKEAFYASINRIVIITCVSIIIMMLLFRWYIKKQFINRVAYIESLARRIVNNELDLDIKLSGKDELSSLAKSFNNMKTTLKLSIDRIENHRHYLTNMLNSLTDGILIVNDKDYIVFVNESLSKILKLNISLIKTGEEIDKYFNDNNQLMIIIKLIQQVQKKQKSVEKVIKVEFNSKDKTYLDVHVSSLYLPPLRKPEVIVVVRDITAKINIEKQIYQSDKLATVGRLATGIAHEINNPMASIMTCTEGLLKGDKTGNDTREYLNIIKDSAQRCKIITQKLLDYSAVSNLSKENVHIEDSIYKAMSLLQFEASKKKINLTFKKENEIPPIMGSMDSLVQVFVNLILNSIQAVDVGGHVDVILESNKKSVDIFINDDGIGISKDILEDVFEPFFTTKPVGMGTGMGLSVSQGIIKQHNGSITIVKNQKGFVSIKVSLCLKKEEEII